MHTSCCGAFTDGPHATLVPRGLALGPMAVADWIEEHRSTHNGNGLPMNNRDLITVAAIASAVMLALTACSRSKDADQATVIETADGAIAVDTATSTATVTGIDAATRELTLVTPNGKKTKYKAGPDVANFDQIKIGDQVKALLTEEVAVSIGSGRPQTGTSAGEVALAPVGAKPGGVMVQTSQVTVKIVEVDAKKHKVTYQLADGSTRTVKAGKEVDVSVLKPGDNVTVRVSDGVAVLVEKP